LFIVNRNPLKPQVLEVVVSNSGGQTAGSVVGAIDLTPWPIPKPQGLSFDQNGLMYVVTENEPGPEDHWNVFKPSPTPGAGAQPLAITENNSESSDGPRVASAQLGKVNYIYPGSPSQVARIPFEGPGAAKILIFDQIGNVVFDQTASSPVPGENYQEWNLQNPSGQKVASGTYPYHVKNASGKTVKGKIVYVQ
jgi:hypothetical protein